MNIQNLMTQSLMSWDDLSKVQFPIETREVIFD